MKRLSVLWETERTYSDPGRDRSSVNTVLRGSRLCTSDLCRSRLLWSLRVRKYEKFLKGLLSRGHLRLRSILQLSILSLTNLNGLGFVFELAGFQLLGQRV